MGGGNALWGGFSSFFLDLADMSSANQPILCRFYCRHLPGNSWQKELILKFAGG